MKAKHFFAIALILVPGLALAAPRFYVTAQAGRFNADAGSTELGDASPFVVESIESGTMSFFDVSLGAEFTEWFSLEAGYVEFDAFRSNLFRYRPGINLPGVPSAPVFFYNLRGYRLTPIVRVFSTDRFALKILGGVTHPTGEVVRRDFPSPNPIAVTSELDDFAFHGGLIVSYNLFRRAAIDGRVVYHDFGKPENNPNRITSINYSLGLSWHF